MKIKLPNQTTIDLLKRHEFICVCGQTHRMDTDEIVKHYGASAESVYAENAKMAFDEENVCAEVVYLLEHMKELKACVKKHLDPYDGIEETLKKVGCITSPAEIGFTREQVIESLCYAHYNRKKYTILRMLSRLGCLEEVAERVTEHYNYNR